MPLSGLAQLLGPQLLLEFLENYKKKQVYYTKIYLKNIFLSWQEKAKEVLAIENLRYPDLRLVDDGSPIPSEHYTESYLYNNRFRFNDVIKKENLVNYFEQGCSVVITHAHRLAPQLNDIRKSILLEVKSDAHINLYLTPPNSQGYKLHYDKHDVLVIQLMGEKIWEIYNTVEGNKIADPFMDHITDCDPNTKREITLKEGEILYVPKGTFHNVFTRNHSSFHMTIGLLNQQDNYSEPAPILSRMLKSDFR